MLSQAGTFYSPPSLPTLSLSPLPRRCALEGIQKGLSRERLRAGCGHGIKAYANRPSSAFLPPRRARACLREDALAPDGSPSLDGTARHGGRAERGGKIQNPCPRDGLDGQEGAAERGGEILLHAALTKAKSNAMLAALGAPELGKIIAAS